MKNPHSRRALSARLPPFSSLPYLAVLLLVLVPMTAAVGPTELPPALATAPPIYYVNLPPQWDANINDCAPEDARGARPLPLEVSSARVGDFFCRNNLLLYFNLRGAIPGDAVIQSAILRLDVYQAIGPDPSGWVTLTAERITSTWAEWTVTWNSQPTTTASGRGTALVATGVPAIASWDVTSIAQGWFNGSYPDNGLMIRPVDASDRFTRIFINPRLEVGYTSSAVPPTARPTAAPIPDSQPPVVTITTDPPSPMTSTSLTIHALATDNVGLGALELRIDGVVVRIASQSAPGVPSLTIDFPTTLEPGPHILVATAWDLASPMPNTAAQTLEIHIGSQTVPLVTIQCSPSEVLPDDQSTIEVTATASDPEGIRELLVSLMLFPDASGDPSRNQAFTYLAPYPTQVTETARFNNLGIASVDAAEIPCMAVARDAEYQWSETAASRITVHRPYQWDYGLFYHNPSRADDLPMEVMNDVFGWGETHDCGPLGYVCWWTLEARVVYDDIKGLASNGECFGMSAYSDVWGVREIALPDTLTHDGEYGYMHPQSLGWLQCEGNSTTQECVRRSIERFHAAQFSDEVMNEAGPQYMSQFWSAYGLTPFVNDQIPRIASDLANGLFGVLCMTEERSTGSAGHAVVPWRLVQGPTGWRIFVYDSNREGATAGHQTDYGNYDLYPYLDLNEMGFGFRWPVHAGDPQRIWNGYLAYVPFSQAARNDYSLPSGTNYILLIFSSAEAEVYAEDAQGAITGVVDGQQSVAIPGSTPILLPSLGETVHVVSLPLGQPYSFHVQGNAQGTYDWAAIAENSTYAVFDKSSGPAQADTITLETASERLGYSLRLQSQVPDDTFGIAIAHPFGEETREYELASVAFDGPADLEVYAGDQGNNLVIVNRGEGPVTVGLILRSTESNDPAGQVVGLAAGEQVTIVPEWSNLGQVPLRLTRARIAPQIPPLVVGVALGVLGVAVVVVTVFVIVRVARRR
jgi:hypothetical protein